MLLGNEQGERKNQTDANRDRRNAVRGFESELHWYSDPPAHIPRHIFNILDEFSGDNGEKYSGGKHGGGNPSETMIFASNGRTNGFGSFDLYITKRTDNTWQNWTEPQNLGSAVNSRGSETSFIFRSDDDYAYFVSTTDSDGYGDIRKIKIKSDIEKDEGQIDPFILREKVAIKSKIFRIVDKISCTTGTSSFSLKIVKLHADIRMGKISLY